MARIYFQKRFYADATTAQFPGSVHFFRQNDDFSNLFASGLHRQFPHLIARTSVTQKCASMNLVDLAARSIWFASVSFGPLAAWLAPVRVHN